jgi:hypothetical protein
MESGIHLRSSQPDQTDFTKLSLNRPINVRPKVSAPANIRGSETIMRVRAIASAALLAIVAMSSSPAFAEWKAYQYPFDQFAVDFPVEPTFEDVSSPPPAPHTASAHFYRTVSQGVEFIVAATRYDRGHEQFAADDFFRDVSVGLARSMLCKVSGERPISIAGGIAQEFTLVDCDRSPGTAHRISMYVTDRWMYQLFVNTRQGRENDPEAQRFLGSFKLTAARSADQPDAPVTHWVVEPWPRCRWVGSPVCG